MLTRTDQGTSGGVMVSKLDKQTFTSEFNSYWVLLSYSLQSRLSKKINELQQGLKSRWKIKENETLRNVPFFSYFWENYDFSLESRERYNNQGE